MMIYYTIHVIICSITLGHSCGLFPLISAWDLSTVNENFFTDFPYNSWVISLVIILAEFFIFQKNKEKLRLSPQKIKEILQFDMALLIVLLGVFLYVRLTDLDSIIDTDFFSKSQDTEYFISYLRHTLSLNFSMLSTLGVFFGTRWYIYSKSFPKPES